MFSLSSVPCKLLLMVGHMDYFRRTQRGVVQPGDLTFHQQNPGTVDARQESVDADAALAGMAEARARNLEAEANIHHRESMGRMRAELENEGRSGIYPSGGKSGPGN